MNASELRNARRASTDRAADEKIAVIRHQVFEDVGAGKSLAEALGAAIFNHGVEIVREAFGLPAPIIRSIFFRHDCAARALLAARQMLARAAGRTL